MNKFWEQSILTSHVNGTVGFEMGLDILDLLNL